MKNSLSFLFILTLLVLFTSCNDFLGEDPKGELSPANFFQNKNDLDLAINAMFNQFQQINQQAGRGLYAYIGDDITAMNSGNKARFAEYDRFFYNSGNRELVNLYSALWSTVKAANFVINNGEKTPADEAFVNARVGQAYLIRGYSYFMLVRLWGNIPVFTENEIDFNKQREEPSRIYELIESDLLKAEEMLPIKHDVEPYFRNDINVAPAKGAAKALLASVYMTKAGWPLNLGESSYDKAAAKFKEIIDNEGTYGYQLEPNIMDLTIGPTANYSKEIVFGEFHNTNQNLFMGSLMELPEESRGWADLLVEIEFYNSMPDGPRKEAWILSEVALTSKIDPATGRAKMVPWNSTETNQQHPYWRKNIDNGNWDYERLDDGGIFYTNEGIQWSNSRTRMIYRYADILVLYAEAKAFGSSGPDALAYQSVNRVRERAGLEPISNMSQTDFQQAVLDERRWETAGLEHSAMGRFFTMQRHEILHKQKDYRDPEDTSLNPALELSEDFYYLPIPDQEKLIVPDF